MGPDDDKFTAEEWALAPHLRGVCLRLLTFLPNLIDADVAADAARRNAAIAWNEYHARCCAFIPFCALSTSRVKTLQINTDGSLERTEKGGRPANEKYDFGDSAAFKVAFDS